MHRERIHAVPSWRSEGPQNDCVFLDGDPMLPGFRGLHAARVLLLFSFKFQRVRYPCALVSWFQPVDNKPDEDTGMWVVAPVLDSQSSTRRRMSMVHLDTVLQNAHLIGKAGQEFIPRGLEHYESLDAFKAFYVNKYADHHAHTIAF